MGNSDALAQIVAINARTETRDKFYRLMQYGSKFLGFYLARLSPERTELLSRLKKLEESVGTSRKLFRLAKPADFLATMRSNMGHPDPVLRLSIVGRAVALSWWLVCDHIVWAARVGLVKWDKKWWGRLSARGWIIGLLLAVLKDLYGLLLFMQRQQQAIRAAPPADRPQVLLRLEKERRTLLLGLLKNVLDLNLPANVLGYTKHTTGRVGAIGVVTSLIGAYQVWPKVPKSA